MVKRKTLNEKEKVFEKKRLKKIRSKIGFIQSLQPAPALSKEQDMLQELFNGEPTFGTGENLPKVSGVLRTGHGLINNGDDYEETASMFGVRRY